MPYLTNVLNTTIILLSTLPIKETTLTPHNVFIYIMFLLFSLPKEEVISLIILVFASLYSFTFTNIGSIVLIIAMTVYLTKKNKNFKIVSLTIYLLAVTFFHNQITPILVIAYIILNFYQYLTKKQIQIAFALASVLLLIPFPEFTLDFSQRSRISQKRIESSNLSQNYSQQTFQRSKTQNIITQKSDNSIAQRPSPTSVQTQNIRAINTKLFKLTMSLAIFFSGLGALYTVILTFKAQRKDRFRIWFTFFTTSIVLLSLFFFMVPSLFKITQIPQNQMQKSETSEKTIVTDTQQQTSIQQSQSRNTENHLKTQTKPPINFIDPFILSTFAYIFAIISTVIAIWFLTRKFISIANEKALEQQNEELQTQPTNYSTDYSYQDILNLESTEFIDHSYRYIRKTFFPQLDHLTPYELIENIQQTSILERLAALTESYVTLKYALVKTHNKQKIDQLKHIFQVLCQELANQKNAALV
ncbi:MAG: hypothetical protein ACP5JS_05370 [Fervidobacterium sp.]